MIKKSLSLIALLAALLLTVPSFAGGGGGGPGGGFGGGGFGRMTAADRVRQQVGFSDDEWTVIQPKLQKILDAQASLQTNQRGFGGGFAGQQAGTPDAVQVAQQELTTVLQDQNTATDIVSTKMKALRNARAKAKETLSQAQDDLKKVLTVRQEAILLDLGYLE